MRNRTLLLTGLIALLGLLLFGCSLGSAGVSQVTPTPTKTLRPVFTSTLTPTVPKPATETPVPADTPLPPDTPVPPTEAPATDTPEVADTPVPVDTPVPTESAIPATSTPVPPTNPPPTNPPPPPPTNTTAPPANTPQPGVDFRVREIVAFEDGSLSASGLHNIYFTVIDANGTPLDGIVLKEVNNQPAQEVTTGNKGPGKTEFTMWAADYRFEVDRDASGTQFSSETTHVLSVLFGHAVWDDLIRGGICTDPVSCEALGPIHYSYNVTFQRSW